MLSSTNAIYLADKLVIDICDKFKNLDQDPKLKSRIFVRDKNSRNQIRERNILAAARVNFDRQRTSRTALSNQIVPVATFATFVATKSLSCCHNYEKYAVKAIYWACLLQKKTLENLPVDTFKD